MGSNNFETKSLLSTDTLHGGTTNLVIYASETKYTPHWNATHLDSIYGVAVEYVGTRYGGNVTLQLQQSMNPGRASSWADVGSSSLFGSGGTSGSPASVDSIVQYIPAVSATFLPFLRVKITCASGTTQATITDLWRTARGLK